MSRVIRNQDRFYRGSLIISFLLLAFAAGISYHSPATTYELDIYHSTPILFWFFVGISLFISVIISIIKNYHGKKADLSLVAAGIGGLMIVGLPLLRGHHHIGEGDMMTHIGWTNELLTGIIDATDLFYPAVHLLATTLIQATGWKTPRVYIVLSPIFVGIFIMFTALCVRRLSQYSGASTIGVFLALLLLPLNHGATHLQPIPRNVTIYLFPLLLFALVYQSTTRTKSGFILSSVLLVAYLTIHPQFAIASFLVFLTYATTILTFSRVSNRQYLMVIRPIILGSFALAALTWYWIADEGIFERFFGLIASFIIGTRNSDGELASRGNSLVELGSGLPELFLKLYLVPSIVCLIVALYGLWVAAKAYKDPHTISRNDMLYLALLTGIIPLAGIMAIFLAMGRVDYLFRYQGFVMALVTILGAVAIRRYLNNFPTQRVVLFTPIFFLALLLSLLVVFPSPFIYNDVEHVTESQMEGYETMFDHADPNMSNYDYIRSSASRYGNAIIGPSSVPRSEYYAADRRRGGTPDHFNNHNLSAHYSNSTYLAVTVADKKRDAELYNGFRFSWTDFAYLNRDPSISKVHSSGDAEFYYIQPDEGETENQ